MNKPNKSLILLTAILSGILLTNSCSSTNSDSGNPGENPGSKFDSGIIAPNETYSFTFSDEGDFEYFCEIHAPNMQGIIRVDSSGQITEQDTVEMVSSQFQPDDITVFPNTTIVWVNHDQTNHTVVSGNPSSNNTGGPDY